jgi:hypothetical protein
VGGEGRGRGIIGRAQVSSTECSIADVVGCMGYVAVLINTCKRGLSLDPLSVSSETQCLSSSPLSPRLELLPSRLTPREAKGGRP